MRIACVSPPGNRAPCSGRTLFHTRYLRKEALIRVSNNTVELPPKVCVACFNEQQRLRFPFLVYCRHNEVLALLQAPHEHATFDCSPQQLERVVHRLGRSNPTLDTTLKN